MTVIVSELQGGWESAYRRQGAGDLWQEAPIPVLAPAIDELRRRDVRTVADLGCGDGRNLAALVDAGLHCVGVDIAPTGIARARERIGNRAFYITGDATSTTLADSSVDAVTCFDVFGQVADPSDLVAEAARILVPGGLFVTNAFTVDDETFGEGEPIGERMFAYKDTLFRYYTEEEMLELLAEWTMDRCDRMSWQDPPHGEFRPYPHRHDNWVVFATKTTH